MGTTADKLNKLITTKTSIKNAIISKGVAINDSDTFSSYAEKISQIQQTGETTTTDPYLEDRVLIFEDDFNGTELDTSKWSIEIRDDGCGNNEIQDYVESQVSISNSNLVLTATKVTDEQWLSGRINSNDKIEIKFGRIEAKIKMDAYQGYWQAFWLLGADHYENSGKTIEGVAWPNCGEIDIIEHVGAATKVQSCYHCMTDSGYRGGSGATLYSGAIDMTQYHVYAIEWVDGKMEYSVDGVVYGTHDVNGLTYNGSNPFSKAYYIIFNFAIGGTLGGAVGANTPTTSNMYVDWVRAYAPKSTIYPETLTLTNYEHDTISMNVGETKQLIFKTTPTNALMPTIKYTSSAPDVAEYHGGVITTKTLGVCTLTTETRNGLSKVLNLTVQDGTSVSTVSLDKTIANGGIGDTITLTATIIPETATNKNVTFAADNENVSLAQDGLTCTVSLLASGSSIVTVTTEDNNCTATCQVVISESSIPTEGLVARIEANSSTINGTTWSDTTGNGNDLIFHGVEDGTTLLSGNLVTVGTNSTYLQSAPITGITDAYTIILGFDFSTTPYVTVCCTDSWQFAQTLPFIEGTHPVNVSGKKNAIYGLIGYSIDSSKNFVLKHFRKTEQDIQTVARGTATKGIADELSHFIVTVGKKGWEEKFTQTKFKGMFIYNRALNDEEMNEALTYFGTL